MMKSSRSFVPIARRSSVSTSGVAVLGVAGAILTESALSFLGLGVQPPVPSWGNILAEGWAGMDIAPLLSVFPGLAITVTMLAHNLFGEGLRDALDPRLSRD